MFVGGQERASGGGFSEREGRREPGGGVKVLEGRGLRPGERIGKVTKNTYDKQ
jgi:hypothetical protein